MKIQKISVTIAITPEVIPTAILAPFGSAIDDSFLHVASFASVYQLVHVPMKGPDLSPGMQLFVSEHQPQLRFPIDSRQFVHAVPEYFGHSSDGTNDLAERKKRLNILIAVKICLLYIKR